MTSSFIPPAPLQTAVLFLVFNRPDTTAQVFEAIRQAKPPRLYVAADGPRAGREGEAERVAKVREIATAVDWPCVVKTLFRAENLGCKYAVSGAITWFFEQEEQGIILEDDCLPSQSFFWFCENMLNRFSKNEAIMSVTGTNITRGLTFEADYFFSRYALMWGWASWARAWKKYDLDLEHWPRHRQSGHLKELGISGAAKIEAWKKILNRTKRREIDTWDYQWIYTCWLHNGLTISQAKNLVRNIGYSNDATHTTGYHPILSNLKPNELEWPLKEPLTCAPNSEVDDFISKHWFGVNWKSFAKSLILRFPGVAKINEVSKQYIEKKH